MEILLKKMQQGVQIQKSAFLVYEIIVAKYKLISIGNSPKKLTI